MSCSFSTSVHLCPSSVNAVQTGFFQDTKIPLPYPTPVESPPFLASSLKNQIIEAVQHPKEFESAMEQILSVNLHFLKLDPRYRNRLCPATLRPDFCFDGRFCQKAGSLAEFYANNIHRNPDFKTRPCRYRDKCLKGSECDYGHPGELMRKVTRAVGKAPLVQWRILNH